MGESLKSSAMRTANSPQAPNLRLGSWKEIAAFFDSDESTVRRWEKERGLPVHRVPGKSGAKVFAYTDELRQWLGGPKGGTQPPGTGRKARFDWPDSRKAGLILAAVLGAVALVIGLRFVLAPASPTPAAAHVAAKTPAPNAEAAAFYRTGLYEWQTRTPLGLTRAVDDFTQAIVRDPGYAEAYAGLANCYNLLREFSTMPPEEAYPRAKAAAQRAIQLNPALGDAHADLAFVDFYWSRDVRDARREFERALALEPHNAIVHHWYANFLMTIREFPGALHEIETAQGLDSASTAILADKGLILLNSGKLDDAATLLGKLEQAEPAFPSTHSYLAIVDFDRGDDAGFLHELEADAAIRHDADAGTVAAAGRLGLARGGRDAMLAFILGKQKEYYAEGRMSAFAIAVTSACLNKPSDAIAWLKLSVARHEADNVAMAVETRFSHLREDASFRTLLSKAGLPSEL